MKRIFISILILLPLLVFAQFNNAGAGATIRISPSLPNPLSQTKASLIYDGFDLTKASIRWTLNNKTIKSGTGAKDVTFQVGPAGSDNRLSVFASSIDGEEVEAAINIVPSVIDILMESDSYVPKWYKGGSLTTQGSKVKIVAIPHFTEGGRAVKPENLIYKWSIDNQYRVSLSGKGRQSLVYPSPMAQTGKTNISVVIENESGAISEQASVSIINKKPQILFYEKRGDEGEITSQAFRILNMTPGTKTKLQAEPFYMNFSSINDLTFDWNLDGSPSSADDGEPNAFTITTLAEAKGNHSVGVLISNIKNALDRAEGFLRINVK